MPKTKNKPVATVTDLVVLRPESFTVQHVYLGHIASLTFTYAGLKGSRASTVTVQEPVSLISRKDGKWTVKARNAANTRTLNLHTGTLRLVTYKGEIVEAMV